MRITSALCYVFSMDALFAKKGFVSWRGGCAVMWDVKRL